ncbi:MAG: PEP-CTERM sorting domain-containing protein [Phycisphaerae bacterium]
MKSRTAILFSLCVVVVVGMGLVSVAQGAYLVVYGSPAYDANTGSTFAGGEAGGVNDAGTAVGWAEKYDANSNDVGPRAVRWSASTATELGNLGVDSNGVTWSYTYAINSTGTAVGYAQKVYGGSGSRAVRWKASGTAAVELGDLGGDSDGATSAAAYAINDTGTAVGLAQKYDANGSPIGPRAVRWAATGTAATELGNLGADGIYGYTYVEADAINTPGTAVGYAQKYVSGSYMGVRAVRWDASGTAATELGNIGLDSSGFTYAYASAINNAGTAAGRAQKYVGGADMGMRAVRWAAGGTVATELDNLGTDANGYADNRAVAINATGTAVGYAEKYDGAGNNLGHRAARWGASGTAATELGNLGTDANGYTFAEAYAINTSGITVGFSEKYVDANYTGDRAVYWGDDGIAVDLNTLIDPNSGWTLTNARAISDTGWVTGEGWYDPDGAGGADAYERLFLVQIPEPASLCLLGLGGLGLLRRRR